MTRVRVICLAPPKNWTIIKEKNNLVEILSKIDKNSNSWINVKGSPGTRCGIYRKPIIFSDNRFFMFPLVWDKIVSSGMDIETIINSEENEAKRTPHASAIPCDFILDLHDGICYLVDRGLFLIPFEKFESVFKKLVDDAKLPLINIREFSWDKETLARIPDIARNNEYKPYIERGRTAESTISAKGDLDHDAQLRSFENNVRNGKWTTYAYMHDDAVDKYTFSLRGNVISISNSDENKDPNVLLGRILKIKKVFEEVFGATIPDVFFKDYS